MTKIFESQPLFKKRWRGITYDYGIMIQNTPNVEKLVCLTQFEINWLQANVQYMAWNSRWTNCPCTPEELQLMASTLEDKLMNCFDLNYNLGYLVQQTNDNLRRGYNEAYNLGGIPELNPNTPTDFYSGDNSVDRIDSLCMAVDTYIRSYLSDWIRQAQLAQLGLFFGGLAISVTPFIGIVASVAIGGLAFITQTAIDACRDEEAIADVVCCMYNALIGQAVNEVNFENSLNACSFIVGSNQSIIRDLIASDLGVFDNWLSFLNALGDSYVYMQAGVEFSCPCNGQWCYFSEPRWTDTDNWVFQAGIDVDNKLHSTGLFNVFNTRLFQTFNGGIDTVTINANFGSIDAGNSTARFRLYKDDVIVFNVGIQPNAFLTRDYVYDISSVTEWDVARISFQAGGGANNSCYLNSIKWEGSGVNPFPSNNC